MACLAVVLLFVLVSGPALAAAWTLLHGETRTYSTSTFTYGNHGFDDEGNLVKVPEYRKFTLNASLEHGIRPWLTAIVRGELRQEYGFGEIYRAPYDNPIFIEGRSGPRVVYGYRSQTFGSVLGGARMRVLDASPYVASVETVAATGGFDSLGTGAPSDGPFLEARALVGTGRPLFGKEVFANAEAGYRWRIEADDKDEVVVDLTVGAHVHPRWMVLAQTFSTFEVDGNVHYTKASGSVVYRVNDRLQLEFGGLATVLGRNAIQEFGGRAGFWWAF